MISIKRENFLNSIDEDNSWSVIEKEILSIFSNDHYQPSFVEFTTHVNDLLKIKKHLDIYQRICGNIENHVSNIRNSLLKTTGNYLLEGYISQWRSYTKSSKLISSLLIHLDPFYSSLKINSTEEQFKQAWIDHLIAHIDFENVFVHELILSIQHGVSKELLVLIFQSFFKVDNNKQNLYERIFESKYLSYVCAKHTEISDEIQENTSHFSDFIDKANSSIDNEVKISAILPEFTRSKIIKDLHRIWIIVRVRKLCDFPQSNMIDLLNKKKLDDLNVLCKFLSNMPEALEEMLLLIESHILSRNDDLKILVDSDCNLFIKNVLQITQFLQNIKVIPIFEETKFADEFVSRTLNNVINLHPLFPEHLSNYISQILCKNIAIDNCEDIIEECFTLVHHLSNQDEFEFYYRIHLAKRLINDPNVCPDLEKSLLIRLKSIIGDQCTHKMQLLIKDIEFSRSIISDYRCETSDKNVLNYQLNVRILTAGSWPTQAKLFNTMFPKQVADQFADFCRFYIKIHPGRRLTLQPDQGFALIQANNDFSEQTESELPNEKKKLSKFCLQVSTFQMCIMLLFNANDVYTIEEIKSLTNIPFQEIVSCLKCLTSMSNELNNTALEGEKCIPLFIRETCSDKYSPDDTIKLNKYYKSKQYRIVLQNKSIRDSQFTDTNELASYLNDERKFAIEAAIVRILKSRKALQKSMLVNEVVSSLRQRFIPAKNFIEERIARLIDREFIRYIEDTDICAYM